MLKRVLAIMLTGMMLTIAFGFRPTSAQSVEDAVQEARPDDTRAEKVRMDVMKLGVGEKARVEIKLRDNSKLKGYIGETGDDSFTVLDTKNGSNQSIAYAEVEKVKKTGGGSSSRSWIILGAAAVGALATWMIVKPALCDGGAQTRGPC